MYIYIYIYIYTYIYVYTYIHTYIYILNTPSCIVILRRVLYTRCVRTLSRIVKSKKKIKKSWRDMQMSTSLDPRKKVDQKKT